MTPTSLFIDRPVFNFIPGVQIPGLSDDENRIAQWLAARIWTNRGEMLLSNQYYEGLQRVTNLGISMPPELDGLRAVLGWAQAGVDALDERLDVQGFRLPGVTTADDDLWAIWEQNNLSAESKLVHLDSLVYGSAYVVVGPSDDGDGVAITPESPLNMAAIYDTYQRRTRCAYQTYVEVDPLSPLYAKQRATLYLPDSTIHVVNDGTRWELLDRDDHDNDMVPVVPFLNRQRTGVRVGRSEITAAWKNTIDRASRHMVAMEGIREFFGAPKMMILGAAESAFQKADGTTKSAWETYLGRVLALEVNDDGDMPQVVRFAGEDPGAVIRLVDHERHHMAGLTGLPPQYLGIFSDGNPASADAIRMSDYRLQKKADRKAVQFGDCWEQVMRLAVQVRDGRVSDEMMRLESDWAPTGVPTPAADTDALTKQVAAGLIPAVSDVALTKLGYSANERERIAAERAAAERSQRVSSLVDKLTATGPTEVPPPDDDAAEKAAADAVGDSRVSAQPDAASA